jgi:hypothetical protein
MECGAFTAYNGTEDNIHLHHHLQHQKLKPDVRLNQARELPSEYDIQFNRSETNRQYFNLSLSHDLRYVQVFKHQFSSYDDVHQVADIVITNEADLRRFEKNPLTTKLYGTPPRTLGLQTFDQVFVKTFPQMLLEKEKTVNETILGIPIKYNDVETQYLRFEKTRAQPLPREHLH